MKSVRRITVEIPAGVDDTGLFEAIADAAYDWMPAERDGWDTEVSGTVVRRLDEDELDEKSKNVEEWLDNLDPSTLEWKDGSDIRRITYAAQAYTSAERRLVAAIRRARTAGEPEGMIHLAANAEPDLPEPDDDVIIQSPEEYQRARERALESIGMTYEELAEQARTGLFSSPRARKVWVVIGDHWRGDEPESDSEERAYRAEAERLADDPEEQTYRKAMRERRNRQARRWAAEDDETHDWPGTHGPRVPFTVERDEDGVWCIRAELRPGVVAFGDGKTRQAAVENLRDGLVLLVEDAESRREAEPDDDDDTDPWAYQIQWSNEDQGYVATVDQISGLSWIDPDKYAALRGISQLVVEVARDLTREEAWDLLDGAARRWLGMSAEQFEREHDLGWLPDSAKAGHVSDLLHLARQ